MVMRNILNPRSDGYYKILTPAGEEASMPTVSTHGGMRYVMLHGQMRPLAEYQGYTYIPLAESQPVEAQATMVEIRNDYERRIAELEAELAELQSIIVYIDDHAPRADETCEEPGITLSEAARRAPKEQDAK